MPSLENLCQLLTMLTRKTSCLRSDRTSKYPGFAHCLDHSAVLENAYLSIIIISLNMKSVVS